MTPILYDLRSEQSEPAPRSRRDWRGRTVHRRVSRITGIVIHQTAVSFGVSAAQVRRAGGDEQLALARRGLKVPAHIEAFRSGVVAVTDELTAYLHHAGPLNRISDALEIDGLYPGLLDRPETVPREDLRTTWGDKEPQRFEGPVVEAAKTALVWYVTQLRVLGGRPRFIWAHRQSSSTRRADPGEEIWRKLVVEFAEPELGLEAQPRRTWGDGRPIPVDWDERGLGRY